MKIYTKTGDDGTTGLFSGKRVPKDSLRVEAYGTIDELNTHIGLATCYPMPEQLAPVLERINNLLFTAGSDLATPFDSNLKFSVQRINAGHSAWLEEKIDEFSAILPSLKNFILPGGTKLSAQLQIARTVCRRAERLCVRLANQENIGGEILIFLNRLSDFLFTASRLANYLSGVEDKKWTKDDES